MSSVGLLLAIAGVVIVIEAVKHFKTVGVSAAPSSASGSPPSSAGPSAGSAPAAPLVGGGFLGGLLPESWYVAINKHESGLPLPSPGDPQPLFGFIPGAPGNVGSRQYRSGGTAQASADLGLAPGYTVQSLFPDLRTGIGALDSTVSKIPGALDAVRAGDFAAFLNAIAPTYAGAGEGPGFVSQILGSFDPAATFRTLYPSQPVPAG